jgi:hypothetical protein
MEYENPFLLDFNSCILLQYLSISKVLFIKEKKNSDFSASTIKILLFIPFTMAITTIPRKLNIAPYPYKNKFCKPKEEELK